MPKMTISYELPNGGFNNKTPEEIMLMWWRAMKETDCYPTQAGLYHRGEPKIPFIRVTHVNDEPVET